MFKWGVPYDRTYVTPSGMVAHGWTAAAIRNILGAPDLVVDNPHGGKHPMKLYCTSRVLAAEQSSQFAEHLARTGMRNAVDMQEVVKHLRNFVWATRRIAAREQK